MSLTKRRNVPRGDVINILGEGATYVIASSARHRLWPDFHVSTSYDSHRGRSLETQITAAGDDRMLTEPLLTDPPKRSTRLVQVGTLGLRPPRGHSIACGA